MHKHTILVGEITRVSHGVKIIMTTHGQTIPTASNISIILSIINLTFQTTITVPTIYPKFQIINKIFPTMLHNLPSRILNLKGE